MSVYLFICLFVVRLGNVVDIQTGEWVGKMSGLGAGIDSIYEYLFKVCTYMRSSNITIYLFHYFFNLTLSVLFFSSVTYFLYFLSRFIHIIIFLTSYITVCN